VTTIITLYVSTLALIADLIIWTLSFATSHVVMPDWVYAPFFALSIVTVAVAVNSWSWSHGSSKRETRMNFTALSQPARYFLATAIPLAVAAVVTSFLSLATRAPGQPGYNAPTHQYYFDNHGVITLTNRLHYLSVVGVQTRAFISVALLFTLIGTSMLAGAKRSRAKVRVSSLSALPNPEIDKPQWSVSALSGAVLTCLAVAAIVLGMNAIVGRVDSYLSHTEPVSESGTTEYLSPGPKVVFVFCETDAIDAAYECPPLASKDIVILATLDGARVTTHPDPSTDHISPKDLPAVGVLSFVVRRGAWYRIRLTRSIPQGVFVANSPGTVARRVTGDVVLTASGLGVLGATAILLIRRLIWRVSGAPSIDLREIEQPTA
jgi:hypothetical protein